MKKIFVTSFVLLLSLAVFSQEKKNNQLRVQALLCDGAVVAGYVDNGAYLNFSGPGVKFGMGKWSALVGVLPTLRIKEDPAPKTGPRNSVIMPTLGAGITLLRGHFALQVPFYYNNKTAVASGKWNAGLGIGYRFFK